jgi:hypothetical protein
MRPVGSAIGDGIRKTRLSVVGTSSHVCIMRFFQRLPTSRWPVHQPRSRWRNSKTQTCAGLQPHRRLSRKAGGHHAAAELDGGGQFQALRLNKVYFDSLIVR